MKVSSKEKTLSPSKDERRRKRAHPKTKNQKEKKKKKKGGFEIDRSIDRFDEIIFTFTTPHGTERKKRKESHLKNDKNERDRKREPKKMREN